MTLTDLDPAYVREAERLCRTYGTLVIADEIQTGLARMGGTWFASQQFGIKPDLMTVSKTLSGGYAPVGALLISEEVYSGVYNNFKAGPIYFSTFAENNMAMVASLATLEVLEQMNAPQRAQELSDQLRNGLRELMKRYDCIDRIAGRGLMMGLYFKNSDKLSLKVQQALVGAVDQGSFAAAFNVDMYAKKHVVLQIPGPDINAIKFLPPVILTDEDVQYFLGAMEDTMATFYGKGGPIVSLSKALAKDATKNLRKKKAPASDPIPANGGGPAHVSMETSTAKKPKGRDLSS
jgi:ornithine--oxo-acid transaminase